jgi:hypothetical protein
VIQGGDIEIDGHTYGLKFFNNTQEQSIKGNVITLSSIRSKHGLTGVSLEHESYEGKNGKVDRDIIKVTATGKIEFDQPNEEPTRRSEPTKVAIVTDNPEAAIDEIVEMHSYINSVVRHAYTGIEDEETLRAYVSSVFIEANRKGIRYSKTKVETVKEEELNPDDWASAIVPSGSQKGKKLAEIGKPALTKLYEFYLDKGFTTPFAKCVEKAAEDLNLDAPTEDTDDIPY